MLCFVSEVYFLFTVYLGELYVCTRVMLIAMYLFDCIIEHNYYTKISHYSMHCWVSFWGFAEVYFEFTRAMDTTNWAHMLKEKHKLSKCQIIKIVNLHAVRITAYLFIFVAFPVELTRKHVSQMYFKGEVEQELRETARHFTFKFDGDLENFMRDVERSRVSDLYPHHQNRVCTEKGIYTNSMIIAKV